MKRLFLILTLLLLALPVSLAAVAQGQPPVVVAVSVQPDSLLPDFARTAQAGYALLNLYNQLVKPDKDGNIVPDLAESWEVSEDRLTWTFKLRQDVKWHDGEPFTAADVKFTFEYPADPAYAGTAFNPTILGAQEKKDGAATEVAGVKVLDDYTISFTTVEPNALFLQTTATAWIVPEHVLKDVPVAEIGSSSMARSPIGTGPYRLEQWLQDESITFKAFADYFGGKPAIDTYIWKIIPEPSTQITELLTGGVSVIQAVSADDAVSLDSEEGVTVLRLTGTGVNYILFNQDKPFFKDVRVRQAISHAINKQAILDSIGGGFGLIGTSQIFPELPEANPNLKGYPYDPEKARSLLAEAGWTDANGDGIVESSGVEGLDDGTPFSVKLSTFSTPAWTNRAQVIQQFLKAVGIDAQVEAVDFNVLISDYLSPDSQYDMVLSGWVNLLIPTLSDLTANFQTGEANTVALRWSNAELDDLLTRIPTMFDEQERIQAFWRVQEIIEQEIPVAYMDRGAANVAITNNLVIPEVGSVVQLYRSVPEWKWAD